MLFFSGSNANSTGSSSNQTAKLCPIEGSNTLYNAYWILKIISLALVGLYIFGLLFCLLDPSISTYLETEMKSIKGIFLFKNIFCFIALIFLFLDSFLENYYTFVIKGKANDQISNFYDSQLGASNSFIKNTQTNSSKINTIIYSNNNLIGRLEGNYGVDSITDASSVNDIISNNNLLLNQLQNDVNNNINIGNNLKTIINNNDTISNQLQSNIHVSNNIILNNNGIDTQNVININSDLFNQLELNINIFNKSNSDNDINYYTTIVNNIINNIMSNNNQLLIQLENNANPFNTTSSNKDTNSIGYAINTLQTLINTNISNLQAKGENVLNNSINNLNNTIKNVSSNVTATNNLDSQNTTVLNTSISTITKLQSTQSATANAINAGENFDFVSGFQALYFYKKILLYGQLASLFQTNYSLQEKIPTFLVDGYLPIYKFNFDSNSNYSILNYSNGKQREVDYSIDAPDQIICYSVLSTQNQSNLTIVQTFLKNAVTPPNIMNIGFYDQNSFGSFATLSSFENGIPHSNNSKDLVSFLSPNKSIFIMENSYGVPQSVTRITILFSSVYNNSPNIVISKYVFGDYSQYSAFSDTFFNELILPNSGSRLTLVSTKMYPISSGITFNGVSIDSRGLLTLTINDSAKQALLAYNNASKSFSVLYTFLENPKNTTVTQQKTESIGNGSLKINYSENNISASW